MDPSMILKMTQSIIFFLPQQSACLSTLPTLKVILGVIL